MIIPIVKLHPNAKLPTYATDGSAGMDLYSDCTRHIPPNECVRVSTGISIAIPEGFEGQIRSKSGLALNYELVVLNSPGTIDSDYRGEIKVLLMNVGTIHRKIMNGDKIAQLIIAPVVKATWVVVDSLSETERGKGGFGSTGR